MPNIIDIFEGIANPTSLMFIALGTTLGVFVGAVPGLTGAMLIALTLPLTFAMSAENALVLLVSMYVGSVSGGLVTATLMRIPGTPASIMTTLDGYPMAARGEASRALGLGIHASMFGGVFSWFFLVLLSGPLAELSVQFGSFEFFSLTMIAMVLIAAVSGDSLVRGALAGAIGIFLALPGTSPATGQLRLTLGFYQLDDGFKLLPVLIGLFAVNQAFREILKSFSTDSISRNAPSRPIIWTRQWIDHLGNLVRSSMIGTWVGILPGIGANIGSMIAYSAAKSMSRTPQQFGTGSEEGIVASESANNATVGGALIPLIAMGIPGSVIDSILLGALVIHGLQPGPLLMRQNPEAVHTIMGTMFIANIFMFMLMLLCAKQMSRLTDIPRWFLVPVILVFCVVGSYALANRIFDVWLMLAMGLFGFLLEQLRIPLSPLVIGFVLAPIAEEHLCAGLMQSGGSYLPLVTRPLPLFFLIVAVVILATTLYRHRATTSPKSTKQ